MSPWYHIMDIMGLKCSYGESLSDPGRPTRCGCCVAVMVIPIKHLSTVESATDQRAEALVNMWFWNSQN